MKERIIQRIKSFAKLAVNWDGYGAKGFKKSTLESAIIFLSNLPVSPDRVFPTSDGAIQFEYTTNEKYIEIVYYDDDHIEYYYEGFKAILNTDHYSTEVPEESTINIKQLGLVIILIQECKLNKK